MKITVINGVNLNFLGNREPEIYGYETLDEINKKIETKGNNYDVSLDFFQSNIEGEIVNKIQSLYTKDMDKTQDFIIINPGAFTHYSIAIRDALLSVGIKTIEVHLSNVDKREDFRKKSVISDIVVGKISGFGSHGYLMALDYIVNLKKELN